MADIMMKFVQIIAVILVSMAPMTGAVAIDSNNLISRDAANATRYVFAHFMVGIVSNRASPADWDSDMIRAKAYGIDAFALNIGTDYFTDTQLGYAYTSAANNGMKVFLSIDFNWWSTSSATAVGHKIAQYANSSAQLMVDGKVFVSTFVGDGVDVDAIRAAAGTPIYFAPNFHPSYGTDFSSSDGGFNWMGWPNNGNNRAPSPGQTGTVEAGDAQYQQALGNKGYIAPVSPWFFTHYGAEVSYSKNWMFPGELLWYTRWQEMLTLGPRFIEIISWNDYGESHYVGPLSSIHLDDGASKWCNDMPHDGWLDMARPFLAAYKAQSTSVANYITADQLIYWYRPQLMNTNCDATDTCMQPLSNPDYYVGRPNGWTRVTDSVFVVALLRSPGTVTVSSGNNTQTFNAAAGATSFTVPMGIGKQNFTLTRNSQTVLSGTSVKDITSGCVCGIYNFNAFVGAVPPTINDGLTSDGLATFTAGLRVSTCSATPSLGKATSTPTSTSAASTSTTTSITTTLATTIATTLATKSFGTTTSSSSSPTSTSSASTSSQISSSATLPTMTTASKTTSSTTSSARASTKTSLTPTPSSMTTSTTPTKSSTTLTSSSSSSSSSTSTKPSSTTSSTSTTTTTTTSTFRSPTQTSCIAGQGSNNYAGLCSFCCNYGYCPPGPCTCSAYGTPKTPPPERGMHGVPADGLDASYSGLCSYACNHGYCPSGACKAA